MSCSDCGVLNCYRREKSFPDFCLTTNVPQKEIEKVNELYKNDSLVSKIAHTAAEIEGTYYGSLQEWKRLLRLPKG